MKNDTQKQTETTKGFGFIDERGINPKAIKDFTDGLIYSEQDPKDVTDGLAELFVTLNQIDQLNELQDFCAHALSGVFQETGAYNDAVDAWQEKKAGELLKDAGPTSFDDKKKLHDGESFSESEKSTVHREHPNGDEWLSTLLPLLADPEKRLATLLWAASQLPDCDEATRLCIWDVANDATVGEPMNFSLDWFKKRLIHDREYLKAREAAA